MKIILHGIASNWDGETNPIWTIKCRATEMTEVFGPELLTQAADVDGYLYARALDSTKPKNIERWNDIEKGDVSITHGGNRMLFAGTIIEKYRIPMYPQYIGRNLYDLGRDVPRDDEGKIYDLVYFLKDVQELGVDKPSFMAEAGYSPKFTAQGCTILNDDHRIKNVLSMLDYPRRGEPNNIIHDVEIIKADKTIPDTVKTRLIDSRCGQGQYRRDLLKFWEYRCSVTKCDVQELLIASHIQPWCDSNNEDRLSRENGLLLTPTLDKAFDRGLITFGSDGRIAITSDLSGEARDHLGLDVNMQLSKITDGHRHYLAYHRKFVFEKWKNHSEKAAGVRKFKK